MPLHGRHRVYGKSDERDQSYRRIRDYPTPQALVEKDIALHIVLAAMELSEPLDSNSDLLAFGPCFGKEAQGAFARRLIELGLAYFDDFVEFTADVPSWCAP
jgi:hypothetical protein